MQRVREDGLDVLLSVKAVPGASRDRVVGPLGDALKVTVTAAPERNAANAAIGRLLAKALSLPPADVRLESGATSAQKVFRIVGVKSERVLAVFGGQVR